jgi:transposase
MEGSMETESLTRARHFLDDLRDDESAAPPEIRDLIAGYASRVGVCLEAASPGRELDACLMQIRLSYIRDLERLLPAAPPAAARWVRE